MPTNIHNIIKFRRGTAAEWASSEPQPGGEVLRLGEPGYEKDTGKLKIGDGITPWNNLSYFNDGSPINPEELQDLLGNGFLVGASGINIDYNDNNNILTISTSGVSFVGHTHVAEDITDFNIAVSGLLPVKDIVAGTGIGVTSNSGIYTINSSNTIASDTLEPDGFVNRTDSVISFNDSSREFNISPKSPATSYSIYNNGVKVVKNTTEIITLPDTTALYFIHFDKSTNNLSYKTTSFNFDTDIPVAHIYYNADDNKAVYFGEERHGIRMDASTHRYLHNVFGTQYVNGLSISNYSTSGDGSADSDATVAIGDGLIYDEDIDVNITNSATPSDPFEQVLYPVAQIPVYYKIGSIGAWTDTTSNNFPLKVGITAQYNLNSAGVWSAVDSDAPNNNRYVASWICATSQEHAPIIAIMGQRLDSSLEQATSNNSWSNLNLNGLPITELRPLYRLIYDTKSSFTNGAKAFLVDVLDIRSHIDTITGLPQNDHGNLYGLADDDHYQYVHIDNPRAINAVHNFRNGLGINTSTPSGALHIVNNDIACYIGDYSTWTNGGKVRIFLDDDDIQNQGIKAFISKVGTSGTFYYGINGTSYTINGGGSGTNVGLYGYAGNAARNWGLWIDSGDAIFDDKVGIGTVSPSGRLDVVGDTNINGLLSATSGNFSSLTVNDTGVSLVGHTHASTDISDFNNSVNNIINTSLSTDIVAGTGVSISYDNINNDLIIGLNGFVPVVSLGTLTGSNAINGGMNNAYQTLTLNGTATTLTKSAIGWPTTSSQTTDAVLKITVTSATTITWTIVTEWFNQPPPGALAIGTHLFLLRGVGTSIVEGHYIGNKTN